MRDPNTSGVCTTTANDSLCILKALTCTPASDENSLGAYIASSGDSFCTACGSNCY